MASVADKKMYVIYNFYALPSATACNSFWIVDTFDALHIGLLWNIGHNIGAVLLKLLFVLVNH